MLDVSFDYRKIKEDGSWNDPDKVSIELKQAHKILWSKELPNGETVALYEGSAENWDAGNPYLVLETSHVKYKLTSDSMINSFIGWDRIKQIETQLTDEEKKLFLKIGYSIGNFILFPGNQVAGMKTLNTKRYEVYYDRFDFTLDSIRKFYSRETSELYDCINRYKQFFDLFIDFKGYCEFFFLQDFVSDDYRSVKYLFEIVKKSAVPNTP